MGHSLPSYLKAHRGVADFGSYFVRYEAFRLHFVPSCDTLLKVFLKTVATFQVPTGAT